LFSFFRGCDDEGDDDGRVRGFSIVYGLQSSLIRL